MVLKEMHYSCRDGFCAEQGALLQQAGPGPSLPI